MILLNPKTLHFTLLVLYRLTLADCAPNLPGCSDVRGAVPTAVTSLLDFSYISRNICHRRGNATLKYTKMRDCHVHISTNSGTFASQMVGANWP